MFPVLQKTKEIALDVLFPPVCLICAAWTGDKEKPLCTECLSKIEVENTLTCPICRARMAENVKMCHPNAPFRLAAATRYENEIVRTLIYELKFGKKTAAGRALADILAVYLKSLSINLSTFSIIPISIHPSRRRERTFNQAEVIAENLAEKNGLPLIKNALMRVKATKAQAEIKDLERRKKNLEGSFAVPHPALVQNKNIILVDDVFTSGATVSEAVRTLKEADAGKIIAAVAAKT